MWETALNVPGEWYVKVPFFLWVERDIIDQKLAAGCQPKEAEWRSQWEKCVQKQREVSPGGFTFWQGHMGQGAAEATRGTARGDSTQELENARVDQCRRQKANENAEQGKTIWQPFYGGKPEALLRESSNQRNAMVEGPSANGCSDQPFHF